MTPPSNAAPSTPPSSSGGGSGGTDLPSSWPGLVAWLVKNWPAFAVLIIAMLGTVGGLSFLRARGNDLTCRAANFFASDEERFSCNKDSSNTQAWFSKDVEKQCILAADAKDKPYVILSAVLSAQIEDTLDRKARRSKYRLTYTVLALDDIKPGAPPFVEEFGSSYASGHEKFFSSHEEVGGGRKFNLKVGLQKGEIAVITTGIDWLYNLPLEENRTGMAGRLPLGSHDDTVEYPNTEDFICDLRIIVTSPTTALRQMSEGAHRLKDLNDSAEKAFVQGDAGDRGRVFTARWTNLVPGDHVGIHFGWDKLSLNPPLADSPPGSQQ